MSRDFFTDPFFAEPPGAASREALASRQQDAVESAGAFVVNGIAADAGRHEPDPDWQPL